MRPNWAMMMQAAALGWAVSLLLLPDVALAGGEGGSTGYLTGHQHRGKLIVTTASRPGWGAPRRDGTRPFNLFRVSKLEQSTHRDR